MECPLYDLTDKNGTISASEMDNFRSSIEKIVLAGFSGAVMGAIVGAYYSTDIGRELSILVNNYISNYYAKKAVEVSVIAVSVPVVTYASVKAGEYVGRTIAWALNPVCKYSEIYPKIYKK